VVKGLENSGDNYKRDCGVVDRCCLILKSVWKWEGTRTGKK